MMVLVFFFLVGLVVDDGVEVRGIEDQIFEVEDCFQGCWESRPKAVCGGCGVTWSGLVGLA
jgi:hypothetical protein